MALQYLFVIAEASGKVIYSENYHSQAEYLEGLFRVSKELAPFTGIKLVYIPPGESTRRVKVFRSADIQEFARMVEGKG